MDDDISDPVIAAAVASAAVETCEVLKKSFSEAQSLNDRNRQLIQQLNDNHRSRIPENMARNVDLISELDSNFERVVKVYSNLSANVSAVGRELFAKAVAARKNVAP